MNEQGKETGMALIVTLLLGLIAVGFIGALMHIVSSGTRISGVESRYTSALQAAKGGASYISQQLGSYNLRCQDASNQTCYCDYLNEGASGETLKCPSSSNSSFAESVAVELGPTNILGDYNVDADLLSKASNNTTMVFTFDLTAESVGGTAERSEIEFVYKVE